MLEFIAISLSVLLMGCTKQTPDQVTDKQPITYTADLVQTRGVPDMGAKFPIDSSFGVLCYTVDGVGVMQANYTYNQKVTRTYEGYTVDRQTFWPNVPLRFFAYTPYTADMDDDLIRIAPQSEGAVPTLSVRVNPEVRFQSDLMIASTAQLSFTPYVWLSFQHALTSVMFQFIASSDAQYKVQQITLRNVAGSGSVSMIPKNDGGLLWTPSTEMTNYRLYQGGDGVILPDYKQTLSSDRPNTVVGSDGYLLLVPQIISENQVTVAIDYSVDGVGREYIYTVPAGVWNSGRMITYRINLL